jgi:rfaE bifunctional protein nucleotidyltransferase chain/domain
MLDCSRKILPLEDLTRELAAHRREQRKIIFVHGVFDLLHRGHVTLLAEAKKLGGILVVGVESDENVKQLKGQDRPIHSQEARLFVLAHLAPVDYLFLIPEYDHPDELNAFYTDIYKKVNADVLATCVEAGRYGALKKAHATDVGMKFVNIPERYDRTTSRVIEILKGIHAS